MGLTEEQTERIEEIHGEASSQQVAARSNERRAIMNLLRALDQPTVNPELVERARQRLEVAAIVRDRIRISRMVELRKTLSRDQWAMLHDIAPREVRVGGFQATGSTIIEISGQPLETDTGDVDEP